MVCATNARAAEFRIRAVAPSHRQHKGTEMGFFTKDIKTMDDLFVHTLRDIYYAENQILKALPEMIEKASDPQLKQGFQSHLAETKGHVQRVEQVLERTLEIARSWPGVTSVGLSVSARAEAARRVYERLGFKAWGVEPGALVLDGRAYDETHMVVLL